MDNIKQKPAHIKLMEPDAKPKTKTIKQKLNEVFLNKLKTKSSKLKHV